MAPRGRSEGRHSRHPRVLVVGAGAFGCWAALELARRGASVRLVDPLGPGNRRSSSGGETRILRLSYGEDFHVHLAARSRVLWERLAIAAGRPLLLRSGLLWLVQAPERPVVLAVKALVKASVPHEILRPDEIHHRYPQVQVSGIRWALFEPGAKILLAPAAMGAVVEQLKMQGGTLLRARLRPGAIRHGRLKDVVYPDGSREKVDKALFACGPWMPQLFPQLLAPWIRPTLQQVTFYAPPRGDDRFSRGRMPAWAVQRSRLFYGVPGGPGQGFKVADHTPGPEAVPGRMRPGLDAGAIQRSRTLLAQHFPALARAPVLRWRLCFYSSTPDHHFIVDRHPEAANLWLAGGGSGHGFKHSPALGEQLADAILEGRPLTRKLALGRFTPRAG